MVKRNDPWIEASDVIPMFPTLVWKIQLRAKLHEAMDAKILAALARMRQDAPQLALGQGWQSEQTLHELEEFLDLISCVDKAAKSVLRFLRIGYNAVEITGCWATVLGKGAVHRAHRDRKSVV